MPWPSLSSVRPHLKLPLGRPDGSLLAAALIGFAAACAILTGHEPVPNAAVLGAVTLAAALSSIAGFAFSAICGALLFHLGNDVVEIVQIMLVCSIANQVAMCCSLRGDLDWPVLARFLVGGALGLPLGVWMLLNTRQMTYTHALGAFLLAYGGYMIIRSPPIVERQHPALDLLAGILGGLTGGAVAFPGAFVTIWCSFKGWSKARQRAIFQPFILVMQILALLLIQVMRDQSGPSSTLRWDYLAYVPGSLLGVSLGIRIYGSLSDVSFGRAVNALLIVSGLSFLL